MKFHLNPSDRKAHPIYRLDNLTPQTDDPELDLELLLDRVQPGDLNLLDPLVEAYGSELYRLAYALIEQSDEPAPVESAIELCSQTFLSVIANPRSFRGEKNLHIWLFKALRRNLRNWRRRTLWGLPNLKGGAFFKSAPPVSADQLLVLPESQPGPEARLLAVLDSFNDQARLATVLHFIYKFDHKSISQVSGLSIQLVQQNLNAIRKAFYDTLLGAGYDWTAPVWDHKGFWTLMLSSLDGEEILAPSERERLRFHLDSCPGCQSYFADLKRLDALLDQLLTNRWGSLQLEAEDSTTLVERIRALMDKRKARYQLPRFTRQAVQLVLLLVLILGVDWAVSHLTGDSSAPVATQPAELSRVYTSHSWTYSRYRERGRGSRQGTSAGLFVNRFDFSLEPALSTDGRWLAYAWTMSKPSNRERSTPEDIQPAVGLTLYDVEKDASTEILPVTAGSLSVKGWPAGSKDVNTVMDFIGGRITSPGLSSNGRWLVFAITQDVDKTSWEMEPCISPDNGCGVILLYDRANGTLRLVSKGIGDALPDGSVMQPAISGDGRQIAYWSNASNLIAGDTEDCSSIGEQPYNCWDLFIYDRATDSTERIPVGRRFEQLMWNEPVGLSFDGRFVALALHTRDRISTQLNLDMGSVNVFVFDRENDQLELVNSKADGTPGNADSLLPVISADGHYVAFSTPAGNLNAADTNGLFDVYLKDLYTGEVQWVSHSRDGSPGDSSSGLISMFDLVNAKFAHLGLSNDGRYVTYLSTSSHLSTGGPAWCAIYGYGRCGNLYVHDTFTQQTWPVFADPQRAGSYISPTVSPDGRWVLAVYQYETCSEPYGCAQVWIYDREQPGQWKKINVDETGISVGSSK